MYPVLLFPSTGRITLGLHRSRLDRGCLEKAVELGGSVAVAKTEIPTVGWYAHIKDSDGNMFGIYRD